VQGAHGTEGVIEMMPPASVVAEDPPVLEPGDRVLDSRSSPSMNSPAPVAYDATASEARRAQFLDAAVAAIGEHTSVRPAQNLDR
jgi:hypothetical protein